MGENYFKDHSDDALAILATEHIRFNKAKKTNPKRDEPRENLFFQELQLEIVNRFIDEHRGE